ncbi:arginine-tRNA-protein transferase [Hirsutella rhossiliensis]|uniref:Arginine-tRNA-protein transferase n=1 Tax=Hirsutella rhossiliensis TaxID=111463 RepID=A0A9P8MRS9_9HYPO|nr:arginine-tRNA-protein transferase [Hirsutella rhossiliensis]KAH0960728.1 arginine-tRNA-protein transferase [Hirsutella rhossiliensis]
MEPPEGTSSDYEFLSPMGYGNSSSCGYCGARGATRSRRFSYYATAKSLSPQFYQTLLDRSWRRSGTLLQFKPSRDQRQAINRFNRYVLGESYIKEAARVYPRSRDETRKRDNEFKLTERVHEAEYANLKKPPEPAHKLAVTLEDDGFTEEKYEVYDNYQKVVHKEAPQDRTPRAFKRFLCNSPLRRQTMVAPDGSRRRLGSYHQCYRIDGDLVAIGILDLLPDCVSSVYFLYHESIHKYAPGKLGALFEIALATEGAYRWWYPGFYIHSCPKMRYKIDYSPQYILDPEALSWDPLDKEILGMLDRKPFVSLSLERQAAAKNRGNSLDDEDGMDSDMPGIPSLAEMEEVDLDHIALKVFPRGPLFETSDLVGWDTKKITDWPSIKASVAELVAALGPDVVGRICLDSSPRE